MTDTVPPSRDPVSPDLHLGWKMDSPSDNEPVYLRGKGLTAHIAVIAQSGSGKSFMLGRMIEEIAAKTHARFLILDPNSDFVKFSVVDDDAWTHPKGKFIDGDTPESFKRRWREVGFNVLTERGVETLRDVSNHTSISLSWRGLSNDMRQVCLGISPVTHPEEHAAFQVLEGVIEQHRDKIKDHPEALKRLEEAARAMWHAELYDRSLTRTDEWPGAAFPRRRGIASASAVLSLFGRIEHLLDMELWDKDATKPIQQHAAELAQRAPSARTLCVDLGSLYSPSRLFLAAGAALDALWAKSREEWTEALGIPPSADPRCPIFVVIDEAHNLAPATPTSESAKSVSECLVRIAMEGRKFGLFLVLVTQRPSRLNGNLLSQCDSLRLMKMSNPADIELVTERFGFVPEKEAERALGFKKGEMLLAGALVEQAVCARVTPRRTVEGGRSLRDAAWLWDPSPEA
jgi:hypothetical protein